MLPIILFELRYRLRRPATYGYFFILFMFSLLFASTDSIQIGGAVGQIYKNAPYVINQVTMVMCIFGTLIISAVMGVPIFRDFEHQFHEIMFTTPVKKGQYLGGRFVGSYLIAVFILSGIIIGIWAGQFMPWADKERFGPSSFLAYWQPFVNYILPNTLLLGAIFFAAGSYFRNQLAIYVQGIVVLSLYLVINQFATRVGEDPLLSMLEPFGIASTEILTKYWTTAEKNTQVVPLTGYLLYNRLLWTGVALFITGLFMAFFKLTKAAPHFGRKRKAIIEEVDADVIKNVDFPVVKVQINAQTRWQQWWFLTRFYARNVFRSAPFWAIAGCGIVNLGISAHQLQAFYSNTVYPVTYAVLDVVTQSFMLFLLIIITFYTGELMWKERDVRLASIVDASPLGSGTNISAIFGHAAHRCTFVRRVDAHGYQCSIVAWLYRH